MTYCISCGAYNTGKKTQDNQICTNCGDTEGLIFEPVEINLEELSEIINLIINNSGSDPLTIEELGKEALDKIDLIREEIE